MQLALIIIGAAGVATAALIWMFQPMTELDYEIQDALAYDKKQAQLSRAINGGAK